MMHGLHMSIPHTDWKVAQFIAADQATLLQLGGTRACSGKAFYTDLSANHEVIGMRAGCLVVV